MSKETFSTCHPERPNKSNGLCKQCYHRQYYLSHRPANVVSRRPGENYGRIPECHPDRPHKAVGLCVECYHKLPDIKAYRKQWAKKNGNRAILKHRYSLSPEDIDRMFKEQNGLCGICHRPPKEGHQFVIDHDHKTKKVRSLVHRYCNMAFGFFENPEWRQSADSYLQTHA